MTYAIITCVAALLQPTPPAPVCITEPEVYPSEQACAAQVAEFNHVLVEVPVSVSHRCEQRK